MRMDRLYILTLCLVANAAHATNYTTTVAPTTGQTISLNSGDTVTISSSGTGPGLAALGLNTTINAPGVTINTADTNGFGANVTSGGILNLTAGTSITTSGTGANGINTSAGTVNASNISILTSGTGANGVKATNTPVTISNSSIRTTGLTSIGITSNGFTARLRGSNLQIVATGDNGGGITAVTTSQFFLDSSSVLTTGVNSIGANLATGASMTLTNDTITTQGINSYGLSVSNTNTLLSGTNLTVATTAAGSYGAVVQSGGSLSLSNTSITTSNSNASALAVLAGGGSTSTVTITGGSLTANQSDAILAQAGAANITLQNGTTVSGGSGNLLNASAASSINFTATNNVVLNGNVLSDTTSIVNMNLLNNSTWTGAATNLTSLTIDPSVWNVTANSNITGTLTNAGIINFVAPGATGFKTLTVGSYVGQNGVINFNTQLGNQNSPSDSLVINGGTATGNTTLNITNIAGKGDLTLGNGITLVNAINGGVIAPGAFVLATPIVVGPYVYTLVQGGVDGTNPNSFFLRSVSFDPSAPSSAFLPGEPGFVPNYRSEVSLYTALPSMELLYGRMLQDTLHQRVGNEEQLVDYANHTGVFLRVINQGGNINDNTIFEAGPDFNYHFLALQAGIDFFHREHADGSHDFAGVTGAVGNGNGDVEHFDGTDAGNNRFNSASAGVYWTHIGVKKWYVDATVQGSWFSANSRNSTNSIKPHSTDAGVSAEGGYPFTIYKGAVLEPQAQIVFQTLHLDDVTDNISDVHYSRSNSLAGRVGLQLANTWLLNTDKINPRAVTAWVRVSQWHETDGNSQTSFPSNSGFVSFPSKLPGNWAEANLGLTGQASKNVALYGSLSRDIYYDNRGKAYNAALGFRVSV
jgi:outer membrane autotransporter protein